MTFFNFTHGASFRQKEGKKRSQVVITGVKTTEKSEFVSVHSLLLRFNPSVLMAPPFFGLC